MGMTLTLYSEKDYFGELNLLKSQKALIVRALKVTKESKELCKLLELSEKQLLVAVIKHGLHFLVIANALTVW